MLPAATIKAITLMTEIASTCEMLKNIYQTTWHNNPEDSIFFWEAVK
jgi:hypothetical protein